MLARLIPLLLLVLTRDGVLHRFDGHHDTTSAIARASAVAALDDGRVAVLAGGRITIDGKPLPGRFDDARALAGGALLWARTDGAPVGKVIQIDARTGKRVTLLELPRLHRLAADGAALFAEADGVIVAVGAERRWKVDGR